MKQKAKLAFRDKSIFKNGLLRDVVIWIVPKSEKYPEGIRYRMALVEPIEGRLLVLFDNHFPKGHHLHLESGAEVSYKFVSLSRLIEDFLKSEKEMEKMYENKRNSD